MNTLLLISALVATPFQSPAPLPSTELGASPLLYPLDFNYDGQQDLCIVGAEGRIQLSRRTPLGYEDVPPQGELSRLRGVTDVILFDANGDGMVDLFPVVPNGESPLLLGTGEGFESTGTSVSGVLSARILPQGAGVGRDLLLVTNGGPLRLAGGGATGGNSHALGTCAEGLEDSAFVANDCLTASSVPLLGSFYPLGSDWFVDPTSGYMGIGTQFPSDRLHVLGTLLVDSGLQFPDGSMQLTADPVGSQGVAGLVGPLGPAGPAGIAGPVGPEGIQGPEGPQGSSGLTGPDAISGPVGDVGPAGPVGPQGGVGPLGAGYSGTHVISISPSAFLVNNNGNGVSFGYSSIGLGGAAAADDGGSTLIAPFYIPPGATITRIEAGGMDTNSTKDVRIRVEASTGNNAIVSLATLESSGSPGYWFESELSSFSSFSATNAHFYYVKADARHGNDEWTHDGLTVTHVTIYYTLP